MDSHFPPQTPVASSSNIVPHFNFPAESELPKSTFDGIFHLRSQFNEETWIPHPNVHHPLPMTELTYDLPSEIPFLLPLKLVDKTTDISEMLNPFNSTSNTYPIDSDSVSIKVLKPGGTPSPDCWSLSSDCQSLSSDCQSLSSDCDCRSLSSDCRSLSSFHRSLSSKCQSLSSYHWSLSSECRSLSFVLVHRLPVLVL